MTPAKIAVPAAATVAYGVGIALHEMTHVVACWVTGSSVEYVTMLPPEVGYVSPSERADSLVRVSTVIASLPLLVSYIVFLGDDIWSWRLLWLAAIAGYLPRSESDWQPVAAWIKCNAVQQ